MAGGFAATRITAPDPNKLHKSPSEESLTSTRILELRGRLDKLKQPGADSLTDNTITHKKQRLNKIKQAQKDSAYFAPAEEAPKPPQAVRADPFAENSFGKTLEQIKALAEESGMRKVNAQRACKAFKLFSAKNGSKPLDKKQFVNFLIGIMKNYDFCDTKAEEEVLRLGFDDVFALFDYDKSGNLDHEEVANCLSLMCGGSINEKIFAAFSLFDVNNSMTLSFDELN